MSAAVVTACPRCGAPTAARDRFCEACGTDLRVRRAGTTAVVQAATLSCPYCDDPAGPDDGYCPACGMRAPEGGDRVEVVLDGGAGVSDRGHVRRRNEDAVALGRAHPSGGDAPTAAVVCDGVSSVPRSELAARAAADAALEQLLRDGAAGDGGRRTRAAVAAGAAAAANLVVTGAVHPPSCTLVCGLVDPGSSALTVGWVGDSRAYWLGDDARLLTTDHVAATAPPGVLDPIVVAARPDALTRWLGADGEPEPDVVTLVAPGPGALLLCSDGLWKYLPDADDLAAVALPVLHAAGPAAAAAALVATALDAGGEDNVTVALLPVRRSTP